MRKLLSTAAMFCVAILLSPATGTAQAPVVVSGGGTGTFTGPPGSQFGMGVVFRGGSVQGHFNCVMAGRSAFGSLHLMKVDGQVTAGTASVAAGTAVFSGTGTLHMDNAISHVAFTVHVKAGGPHIGALQLTVDGPPVGHFPLPPETVVTGQITIH